MLQGDLERSRWGQPFAWLGQWLCHNVSRAWARFHDGLIVAGFDSPPFRPLTDTSQSCLSGSGQGQARR